MDLPKVKNRMGEWLRQAKRRTDEGKAARAAQYLALNNANMENDPYYSAGYSDCLTLA